ncbi:MAG TPA: hypothetical protein VF571_01050 [Pyrinomonadaceae bacterium]|jgi:hypothetical protein
MKRSGAISIALEHFSISCLVCGKEFRAVQGLMRIAVFVFAENKNPVAHFFLAGSCCIL